MRLRRAERRALERNPELRQLLRGAATIQPLSRADVEQRLAELARVPAGRHDDVIEAVIQVASFARTSYARQQADAAARWRQQAGPAAAVPPEEARRRFGQVTPPEGDTVPVTFDGTEARLRADELTVDLLRRWEVADQLVPDPAFDPFPPEPGDPEVDDRDDAFAAEALARIPRG